MKKLLLCALVCLLPDIVFLDTHAESTDYKIAPSDIIIIDVFGEKDLSREFSVSGTGTINYFFLGEVSVMGKTTAQVREELIAALNADYLVDPQIAVDVKKYRVREVFVNGQVNKPGAVLIDGEQALTIVQAIARAGGLTPRASKNRITFTRPGSKEKVLSWDQLLERPETNIIVEPGDIIEVGDKLL
jgi:polysaccharide biosynthesis/export protein VpsN